jgi:predicted ribosomally synthesized peptide with nif11-like leader
VVEAERFYVAAMHSQDLRNRLASAADEARVVELANELGFRCQLDDLKAVLRGTGGAELSETELEHVSGGGGGFSFPKVSTTPVPPFGVPIPYPSW